MARTLVEGLLEVVLARGWLGREEVQALHREAGADPTTLYALLQPRLSAEQLGELSRWAQAEAGPRAAHAASSSDRLVSHTQIVGPPPHVSPPPHVGPPQPLGPTQVVAAAPTLPPAASDRHPATRDDRPATLVQSSASDRLPTYGPQVVAARREAARLYQQACRDDPLFSPHAEDALERMEELGRGGMGVVLRVRDRRLGREAALKLVQTEQPALLLRFRREAEITARLDHPGVPPVYEAGTDPQGRHYLLMRVIQGQPLSRRIAALEAATKAAGGARGRAALDRERRELLLALVKVAETVAYAHERGIVHRDLKPDNVMLGAFGEVMVLDWGLARDLNRPDEPAPAATATAPGEPGAGGPGAGGPGAGGPGSGEQGPGGLTMAGTVLGTPGYMPPEQAGGDPVDARADVYALGAILCEVLSGKRPVEGATPLNRINATLAGRIRTPRQLRRDVPRELDSLAARALAADPARRLPDAGSFLRDLQAWLAGEPLATHRYGPGERVARWARRHPGTLAGVAGLSLFAAVAGGLGWRLQQARTAQAAAQAAGETAAEEQRRLRQALSALDALQAELQEGRDEQRLAARAQEAVEASRGSREMIRLTSRLLGEAELFPQAMGPLQRIVDEEAQACRPPPAAELRLLAQLDQRQRGEGWSEYLDKVQELGETDIALWTGAVKARMQGDLAEAVRLHTRALELNPRWELAWTGRALARRLQGDTQGAVADCDAALRVNPRLARAWLERALAHAQAGQDREAAFDLELGRRCVSERERHLLVMALQELAGIATARGRAPDALAWLDEGVRLMESAPPAPAVGTSTAGDTAAEAGAGQAPRPAGELLRTNRYTLMGCLAQRGQLRLQLGQPAQALPDLERVLAEADPAWDLVSPTRGNRAAARLALGDARGALEDVEQVLSGQPDDPVALLLRADLRAAQGDLRGAIEDARRAAASRTHALVGALKLGVLLDAAQDYPGAEEALSRALELAPQRADAWYTRGTMRIHAGTDAGAIADLTRALELQPDWPDALFNRALAHELRGARAEALADLRRAALLNPRPQLMEAIRARLREWGG